MHFLYKLICIYYIFLPAGKFILNIYIYTAAIHLCSEGNTNPPRPASPSMPPPVPLYVLYHATHSAKLEN